MNGVSDWILGGLTAILAVIGLYVASHAHDEVGYYGGERGDARAATRSGRGRPAVGSAGAVSELARDARTANGTRLILTSGCRVRRARPTSSDF